MAVAGAARTAMWQQRTLCLADFEAQARRRLPAPLYNYIAGACEDNLTLAANRAAMARVGLVPRVLRDTSGRSTHVQLLGESWQAPFAIGPMGLCALMALDGDRALAAAAAAEDIPMVVSATALTRLEDIRPVNPRCWFQAYLPADRDWIDAMLDRVEAAGYGTLVLSVDVPVTANRENLVRARFSTPLKPSLRLALDGLAHPRWLAGTLLRTLATRGIPAFENSSATRGAPVIARHAERAFGQRDGMTWEGVARIRDRWHGRLLIKGILHPQDAVLAARTGADGIILSNHGGRQIDAVVATLDALPGVVAAAGAMPVLVDSGFRRGTDVLKALAMGARMVLIARPFLYAAAARGQAGVRHAIALLKAEIDRDMAMLGITTLAQLDGSYLAWPERMPQ